MEVHENSNMNSKLAFLLNIAKLTKVAIAFMPLCLLSNVSPANAIILTFQTSSFTNQITELDGEANGFPLLTVNRYTPLAGETVTSVIVTITANLASSGTVTNNNPSTSTFRVTSLAGQYDFNPLAGAPAALTAFGTFSPIPSGTAIGTQQLFSSVPVGATRPFSLQTVSGSASQTFTGTDIAGFLGSGSYSYAPLTSIGTVVSGGGGNIAANIATFAGGTLTVQYEGTSVPVPFDFNPAIGIVTLGIYFGTSKLYKRYLINKSGKN